MLLVRRCGLATASFATASFATPRPMSGKVTLSISWRGHSRPPSFFLLLLFLLGWAKDADFPPAAERVRILPSAFHLGDLTGKRRGWCLELAWFLLCEDGFRRGGERKRRAALCGVDNCSYSIPESSIVAAVHYRPIRRDREEEYVAALLYAQMGPYRLLHSIVAAMVTLSSWL